MGIGMTKVLHVKLPVTDLARSVDWYCRLMDLALAYEFVEDGELRGAVLHAEEGGFNLALRLRRHCAGNPDLTGFDVVGLHMATRESLVGVRERCAALGATCTEIQDRTPHEAVVDVTDPDGTLLRFYWADLTAVPDVFVGYEFDGDGPPRVVEEPRLDAPRVLGRT
ncbi:VOC family protein [Actinomycetospora straminea]|uniref:VOC domain-containing protein n=1 Tax=Actinomycetospora straminea TaxID=663607 RepID=A0ABP9E5M9_9PSEU|nr:VOC family protein [Actinomycetospora straminea]MDD7931369.1 VOC family protein [Actinomycetospora straminea]